ncbi:MAG: hypothetical protein ABSA51_07545 [Anaerolineaceae bacterium]
MWLRGSSGQQSIESSQFFVDIRKLRFECVQFFSKRGAVAHFGNGRGDTINLAMQNTALFRKA